MVLYERVCGHQKCIIVVCSQSIPLSDDRATIVHTTANVFVPEGFALEIKNCIQSKYWRVANRYYFPPQEPVTFSILAAVPLLLQPGQVLCHLQCTPLENLFQKITGKKNILTKKFFSLFPTILNLTL